MKARIQIALIAAMCACAAASPAHAANGWSLPETLDVVRGPATPQVGIDASGGTTVAYTSYDSYDDWSRPYLLSTSRLAGGAFAPDLLAGITGTRPRLAVSPSGAAALAWTEDGRLAAAVHPAPGPARSQPRRWRGVTGLAAGYAVSDVQLGIDSQGNATIVWVSPPVSSEMAPPSRLYAVSVTAAGVAGAVQDVAGPGPCRPALDVNLAGDAILRTGCSSVDPTVHFRPAGAASFGPPESIPRSVGEVTLDGAGNALATRTFNTEPMGGLHGIPFRYVTEYAVRPKEGVFGPMTAFPHAGTDVASVVVKQQEDGRAIAAWGAGSEIRYSIRPPAGAFAKPTAIEPRAKPEGIALEVAPSGAALIHWRESIGSRHIEPIKRVVSAASIGADGQPGRARRLAVPGLLRSPSAFAVNDAGQAVGVWEQDCAAEASTAVMVVTFENARRVARPPCQDTRAPKVITPRKRAILRRRALRVRVACNEVCNATASARVLTAGRRAPIGKGKTRGERRLPARRGATLAVRLTPVSQRRIAHALRRGRKVTLRLSVSVRDVYGNGRRWRLKLPLRR